jgi:hypothetical protein
MREGEPTSVHALGRGEPASTMPGTEGKDKPPPKLPPSFFYFFIPNSGRRRWMDCWRTIA